MESGAYPGSDAISIIPGVSGPPGSDLWLQGDNNLPVWATDDDYDAIVLSGTNDSRQYQSHRSQNAQGDLQVPRNTNLKATEKIFFKTKLCTKFRAGSCSYLSNCNYAHGLEELRDPPPNWQEILAAQEEESTFEPMEEQQIPTLGSTIVLGETDRSNKARRCKKFYTDEGCPYGDNCTFLHDEQSKARESVAISLLPTVVYASNDSNQKPSNWKTRICNKWETTGYCPFGIKCHFAHGVAELQKYGGVPMETEGRDAPTSSVFKQVGAVSRVPTDSIVVSTTLVPRVDILHTGVSSQQSTVVTQRQPQKAAEKCRGPNKISKIYGDWIDDFE